MNILCVRNDKIGDFIVTLPAIYLIKKSNPSYKITVIVSGFNSDMANKLDFIDNVIIHNKGDSFLKLYKRIKKENIDIAISFFSQFDIGLALFLTRVKVRFAPATKIAQIFYNHRVKQRRSEVKMSEFEYNIDLAKNAFADIKSSFPAPFLQFDKDYASNIFNNFKSDLNIVDNAKTVGFHVGYGGSSNANLTIDEYINFALSAKNIGFNVVFTFGPGEDHIYEEVKQKSNQLGFYYYKSSLTPYDFSALLSNFFMFIATSTGTFHLAAANNINTLTFFGSDLFSSAKRWKSISQSVKQQNKMIPYDDNRGEFIKTTKEEFEEFLRDNI